MRNPVSVLHIGWWAPAIAALKGAGADVTCVVTANEAPSVRATGTDAIVVPDPGSVEDVLAGLARDSLRPADFSTICSGVEYYLVQAAVVAEIGGTQGAESAQMLAMRDKFVQKDLVRRAGVRTAACTLVESLDRLDLAAVSCPQVLKPLDGAGAKDTIVLRSPDHLREVIAATSAANRGPWLLEEFIPGQEFFADGVVRDGKITFFSLSGYLRNIIECHEGGIVAYRTLSQDEGPDLHTKTRTLAETAFRALGHEDGVFHLEVFWDGAEVVFGECAARVGGGRVDRVVELTYGVNLHDEWALAALGLPSTVTDGVVRSENCYGGLNLRCPQGRLESVPSLDRVLARPGVAEAELYVAAGDAAPDFSAASNVRAGQAVVGGADTRETEERIIGLSTWFYDSIQATPAAG